MWLTNLCNIPAAYSTSQDLIKIRTRRSNARQSFLLVKHIPSIPCSFKFSKRESFSETNATKSSKWFITTLPFTREELLPLQELDPVTWFAIFKISNASLSVILTSVSQHTLRESVIHEIDCISEKLTMKRFKISVSYGWNHLERDRWRRRMKSTTGKCSRRISAFLWSKTTTVASTSPWRFVASESFLQSPAIFPAFESVKQNQTGHGLE